MKALCARHRSAGVFIMKKVVKFGGSSLADAKQFRKVADIIHEDPHRVYVVPSAPGKRFDGDTKVTDLLYRCYDYAKEGRSFTDPFREICSRYQEIIRGLGMEYSLESELAVIEEHLSNDPDADYIASRGEYLNGLVMARYLGYEFVDPVTCIHFDEHGQLDEYRTRKEVKEKLGNLPNAVVPGFYGCGADGKVKTFSRGGSDVTGSIIAGAVRADVYENWTDVSGFL